MPKQYVVCGRPLPRLGTRHVSLLLVGLSLLALLSLLFTLPGGGGGGIGGVAAGAGLQAAGRRFSIPKSLKSPWMSRLNPFRQPSHPPPRQKDDTDGDSWWYADWKWLSMPFSSSVTLDENRALLPVLPERTPIYCYYDNTADKDRPSRDADSDLLLAWRRAWWAHGFRPVILSPAEAVNNPFYEELQPRLPDLPPALREDLMRWLAWENMGAGLLARHLLFPMGPPEDPLLAFLRRAEFPKLTRWDGLADGLLAGPKPDVAAAIRRALASPRIHEADNILTAALQTDDSDSDSDSDPSPGPLFAVDDTPQSLAYYSARQTQTLYPKVGEAITEARAPGLQSLRQLINAHLHVTWQNLYPDGIAVVRPLPQHAAATRYLAGPARELAARLARCPESPMPETCPPNRPKCRPCTGGDGNGNVGAALKITAPPHYDDAAATVYTIGTVPHPYTTATLTSQRARVDVAWIRRSAPRDAWITALTAQLFSPSIPAAARVLRFKESVASSSSSSSSSDSNSKTHPDPATSPPPSTRSLWLTAEHPPPSEPDLDFHFGFTLPPLPPHSSSSSSSFFDDDDNDNENDNDHDNSPPQGQRQLSLVPELVTRARAVVLAPSTTKDKKKTQPPASGAKKTSVPRPEDIVVRDAAEAWSLADTEAWRFARAHLARKSVERRRWEEEEARYAGGMGADRRVDASTAKGRKAWDRWLD